MILTYPGDLCYWHHWGNVLQDIFVPIQLTKNNNVQKILLRLSFWIFLRQSHDDHIWRKISKNVDFNLWCKQSCSYCSIPKLYFFRILSHCAYLAADLPIQYADHWSTLPTALLTAMAALSDQEWSLNVWNNIVVNNVNTGAVDPVKKKKLVKYRNTNSISRKKNLPHGFWHTYLYLLRIQ